jgi:ABC-type uncharacterized transport system permease subunit
MPDGRADVCVAASLADLWLGLIVISWRHVTAAGMPMSIRFKVDQIVSGVAINIFAQVHLLCHRASREQHRP